MQIDYSIPAIKHMIDSNPLSEIANAQKGDELHRLRLLAGHVKGLRYWSTGFDEDDTQAAYWREYHESYIDFYLKLIAA